MFELILLIVVLLVFYFIRLGIKGIPRTLSSLQSTLEQFLKRGYNGGTLVIDNKKSNKFVQFRKYIKEKGVYGIELVFPLVQINKVHIDALENLVRQHRLLAKTEEGYQNDGVRFYCIDFGRNTDTAFLFMEFIFTEVHAMKKADKFYILMQNASVNDELIDCN